MRDQDDGRAFLFRQVMQQIDDLTAAFFVEGRSWFVG